MFNEGDAPVYLPLKFHQTNSLVPLTISASRVHQLFSTLAGRRIAVLGDVMLDRYHRGSVSRISPEAPVPIVEVDEEVEYPGGAANVGYNLATLGTAPLLLGVVGDDSGGDHLRSLLYGLGIDATGLVCEPGRPTTVKARVIAHGQHIVRIDRETKRAITEQTQRQLLDILAQQISTLDAVILQDYNKGVVGCAMIPQVIRIAQAHNVPVYVDPKSENFFEYQGATLFKPNRKEAEDALGKRLSTQAEQEEGIRQLRQRLQCGTVVLTLSADGMMLFGDEAPEPQLVPTRALQVADVSGAGDTVIATLAAARAAGATLMESVVLANHAAGVVCEQIGTVPIYHDALLQALLHDLRHPESEPIP